MSKEEILKKFDTDFPIYHNYCDDCWYPCPKAEGGCCNDFINKDECNCGAEKEHKRMRDWLESILDGYEQNTELTPEEETLFYNHVMKCNGVERPNSSQ